MDKSKKRPQQRQLTDAQAQILDFIQERVERGEGAPSYREIQEHFGYRAVGTVQDHVKALLRKGKLIKASPKKGRRARGLIPASFHSQNVERVKRIPIYGEVAAGSAREAQQLELGSLWVSESTSERPCFALRVAGESMIEVGILEGDYVIVAQDQDVVDGDIVVALLNGETTVKRFSRRNGKILLVPENKRMNPISVDGENFEIQGKVIGLQRIL